MKKRLSRNKRLQAYIIGVALGDGNLSNPNGRATRLRITYDTNYPKLAGFFKSSIEKLLPDNRVSLVMRKERYADISCFSNYWEGLLGWRVGAGSKIRQQVHVPLWIKHDPVHAKECLRGLLQTDGSFYMDRGYPMVNFVNHNEILALDVLDIIKSLGYMPQFQKVKAKTGIRFTVRLSKNVDRFVKEIGFWKK